MEPRRLNGDAFGTRRMESDALLLWRPQFALFGVQIVFPAVAVGLASFLAVLEALWLATRTETFLNLYRVWLRVFAVAFALAIASGLAAAATASPPMQTPVAAGLAALAILEGAVLAAVLFASPRLGATRRFAATLLLAIGALALFAVFAPAAAGSPGPSSLVHLVLTAYLCTALVVLAASAWRLLGQPDHDEACMALKMAIGMVVILAPLMLFGEDLPARRLLIMRQAGEWVVRPAVGLQTVAFALGLWGGWLCWRGGSARSRWFLRASVAMGPAGLLLLIAA